MSELRKKFIEAIANLKEDDGNPSMLQALDYNMDNEEAYLRFEKIANTLSEIMDDLHNRIEKYYPDNEKLKKLYNLIHAAYIYAHDEGYKNLDVNGIKDIYKNIDFSNADSM